MAEPEEISIVEEIRRLAGQEPFIPFAIVMSSGNRYEVGDSDTLIMGRSVITIMPARGAQHLLRQSQISEVVMPGGSL